MTEQNDSHGSNPAGATEPLLGRLLDGAHRLATQAREVLQNGGDVLGLAVVDTSKVVRTASSALRLVVRRARVAGGRT